MPTVSSPTPASQNYVATTSWTTINVTNITHPTVSARTTDVGLYAETDWKIKPNFTFSYGLRFETQNFIHDHKDFAPRLSAAYGLNKRTVLRARWRPLLRPLQPHQPVEHRRATTASTSSSTPLSSTNTTTLPTTCSPADARPACPATTASRLTINEHLIPPARSLLHPVERRRR